jgi:solute carrier family 30 (zinc transporter), member 1
MALSKSRRMQILLAIDVIFFLIELIVGISVHSLALVADSFHMLNDVLSLCVGLWAVHVAKSKPRSKTFTYGWQGAETLGALVNGVFLAALCFSIMLEAIERFFDTPEIGDPRWILGVGCAGLVTNILGLFLFHDHSHGHNHSHGEGEHTEESYDPIRASEEGVNTSDIADETGPIEDVLPENRVRFGQHHPPVSIHPREGATNSPYHRTTLSSSMPQVQHVRSSGNRRSKNRALSTVDDMATHPSFMRDNFIAASRGSRPFFEEQESPSDLSEQQSREGEPTEHTNLIRSNSPTPIQSRDDLSSHANHKHARPSNPGSLHGHSHGDLNMRGVWLHVLGDALGNIGVIATALFIWLTPFPWRFYFDPAVSLLIACIILYSAYPLCRAASRILLMAVPLGVNIDDIKSDVLSLPGVAGCHHLHIWQLSDTTIVASLHVRVDCAVISGAESGDGYMKLARQIRRCLHAYGIHSTTIQPEFCTDTVVKKALKQGRVAEPSTEEDSCREEDTASDSRGPTMMGDRNGSLGCLLDCEDDCGPAGKCCDPADTTR